jgi:hypothetical protein
MKLVLIVIIIGIAVCQDMFAEHKARMINQLNSVRYNTNIKVKDVYI